MKFVKYIAIVIGVLLVLFIGAAIFFVATFDPNAYKEQIVAKTKEATGRELVLEGDIEISVFPWLGFSLGSTKFGNAPGFGEIPMASVEEVDVRIALAPLLKGQINAAKIKLHGLHVDLQKNAQGVTNWDDLVKQAESSDESPAETAEPEAKTSDTPQYEFMIGGVEIKDANLSWRDDQTSTNIQIAPLHLNTSEIEAGVPTQVNMEMTMKNASPEVNMKLALDADVFFDPKIQVLNVSGLNLTSKATGEPFPKGALDLKLSSDVTGNLTNQEFSLNNTNLLITGTGDAFAEGTMDIEINTDLVAKVQTQEFVTDKIEIKVVGEGDALPNGKLDILVQTALKMNQAKETIELSSLAMEIDETKLTGNAFIQSIENPKVKFTLASKLLDLDKLLPASEDSEELAQTSQDSSTPQADENTLIELPTDTLRDLHVNGDISVDTLKVSGMTMTNVKANIAAQNGLLQVAPMSMNLYEGSMKGKTSLDVRKDTPKYSLATELAGVQIDQLSVDFLGEKQAYIRGTSNLSVNVGTAGNSVAQLKQALGGKVILDASDGALRDKKLAANVEKAVALLKAREPKPAGEELVFDKLFGTFNIMGGVADNNDFILNTPLLAAKGKGEIDIGQSETDYEISIALSDKEDSCGVPVKVKGPFEKLSYGVDLQAALKCTQSEKIEEKKEELKEKLEEKLQEELGEDLGKQLLDKIKLF